jgi:GNAT superfamily N-acetyltransferase
MRSTAVSQQREERLEQPQAIRPIRDDELDTVLAIVNEAAEAYRGKIPADCWHEPYMSEAELHAEIGAGVRFSGHEIGGTLAGVMGVQSVGNVDLVRHAYVRRQWQSRGVGSALIRSLCPDSERPWLIGTWRAADWAIRFYEGHGFRLVPEPVRTPLLRTYWNIPERQVEASVVLGRPPLDAEAAFALIVRREGAG